jgi:hypothetical protein
MTLDDTNPESNLPESQPEQFPLTEGHMPIDMLKGHQAIQFGQQPLNDIITRGYSPEMANLSPSSPPQGGSGVPSAPIEIQPSAASDQQTE